MKFLNGTVMIEIAERVAEAEDVPRERRNEAGEVIGQLSDREYADMVDMDKGGKFFVVSATCQGKQVAFKSIIVPDREEERFATLSHVFHLIAKSLVKNFSVDDGNEAPPVP